MLLNKHLKSSHNPNEQREPLVDNQNVDVISKYCFCEFENLERDFVKNHETEVHAMINCSKCEYSAIDKEIMDVH